MKKNDSIIAASVRGSGSWGMLTAVAFGGVLALVALARSVAMPRAPTRSTVAAMPVLMSNLELAVCAAAAAADVEHARDAVRSIDLALGSLSQSPSQVHVPTLLGHAQSELFGGVNCALRMHALAVVVQQPQGAAAVLSLVANPNASLDVRGAAIQALCAAPSQSDLVVIESAISGATTSATASDVSSPSLGLAVHQYRVMLQLQGAVDGAPGDYERASLIIEHFAPGVEMARFEADAQADPFSLDPSQSWARRRLGACDPNAVGVALASSSFVRLGMDPAAPGNLRRRYQLQRQIALSLLDESARAAWSSQVQPPMTANW